MLGLVVALLVVCLGAAVAGVVIPGLFWLTVVALAGILGTGAVGVSMLRPREGDEASPAERRAELRSITPARTGPHSRASQDGGGASRAA